MQALFPYLFGDSEVKKPLSGALDLVPPVEAHLAGRLNLGASGGGSGLFPYLFGSSHLSSLTSRLGGYLNLGLFFFVRKPLSGGLSLGELKNSLAGKLALIVEKGLSGENVLQPCATRLTGKLALSSTSRHLFGLLTLDFPQRRLFGANQLELVNCRLSGSFAWPLPARPLCGFLEMGYPFRRIEGLHSIYSLAVEALSVPDVKVLIAGKEVEVSSFSLSLQEADVAWRCELELGEVSDWRGVKIGDEVQVLFDDLTFTLKVLEKYRDLRFGSYALNVSAVSPAVWGTQGIWQGGEVPAEGATAREAAEAAASRLGLPLAWEILDWEIAAQGPFETPLELISALAASAGALVESLPDGSLRVRYRYPSSPNTWRLEDAEKRFSSILDIVSFEERLAYAEKFNAVEVVRRSPRETDLNAQIEELDRPEDDQLRLAVYLSPFDLSRIQVGHSGEDALEIVSQTYQTEEVTEIIEVQNGEGSLSRPAVSINAWQWLKRDLGNVQLVDRQYVVAETPGHSLLEIAYKVEFLEVLLRFKDDVDALVYVEEAEDSTGEADSLLVTRDAGDRLAAPLEIAFFSEEAAFQCGRNLLDSCLGDRYEVDLALPYKKEYFVLPGETVWVDVSYFEESFGGKVVAVALNFRHGDLCLSVKLERFVE